MHDQYRLKIGILSLCCDQAAMPILDGSVPIPRDRTNTHPLLGQFAEFMLHFEC